MVNVRTNIKEVTKDLNEVQKKQIPFATSRAINETGKLVLKGLAIEANKTFEGGATKQVLNAFKPRNKGDSANINYSNKKTLRTIVFLPKWAAKFLRYQIDGGIRRTKGKGPGVPPRNADLNQYGNIPGRRKGLIKRQNQMIATINGVEGVWEKNKRSGELKLLIAFVKAPRYTKKFKYYSKANKIISAHIEKRMRLSLADALKNARKK